MAAWRDRPVAAWGIPAIPVAAKLGRTPMPPAAAAAAKFCNNTDSRLLVWPKMKVIEVPVIVDPTQDFLPLRPRLLTHWPELVLER